MDIKFERDGFNFNTRSSCIIKDRQHRKVILTEMKAITDHKAYLLPGGRLNVLENSQEAIAREIKEELGIDLNYKLISIEENISKDTKFHMIEFVHYAEIESFDEIKCLDDGWDIFEILDIENIDDVDMRPHTVSSLIKQDNYETVTHNINYDWQ